jgi:superfamily II DNA/RNA helicase
VCGFPAIPSSTSDGFSSVICCLQVLVASDVASRGLDIRGLPYVVNYDFPSNLEVYIHRVGRTGRLAAAGHAFSFFTRPLVSAWVSD